MALAHSERIAGRRQHDVYAQRQKLTWSTPACNALAGITRGNVRRHFTCWVPVPGDGDSLAFAGRLLADQCGLIVAPGVGYGPAGEGYRAPGAHRPGSAADGSTLQRLEKAGIRASADCLNAASVTQIPALRCAAPDDDKRKIVLEAWHQSFPDPPVAARTGPDNGTARIPGDKSISHRALMFGAHGGGRNHRRRPTGGGGCLLPPPPRCVPWARRFGRGDDGLWRIRGVGDSAGTGNLQEPAQVLDMGNSGTSTRLIIGLVARSCRSRQPSRATRPSSSGRCAASWTRCRSMGAQFLARESGRLPLTVRGAEKLTKAD